ncbi:MAG: pitrilysin family protein [Deltaproteobacteria bacterium]|nr:pitrilysin family protein [Deltaproteobacteria bacterium]
MLASLLVSISVAAVPPTFPYERFEKKLDNGLRVVVVPTDQSGFFALYELVGTGSRDEVEPGHSGFAHFFEHIMFRGTKRFPADKRVALLSSLGVDEGGYTTDDFTGYSLIGPKEGLKSIFELEADRYANLEYSEDDFKTESRAVLGEYNKNFANPDEKAFEALSDLAFDKHTYKHTTMGFLKDIERMPKEYKYSREFFKKFYTPDNVMLVVAGDVDVAAVHALAAASFGGWKGTRAKTVVEDEPGLAAERRKAIGWENPTEDRLHVGWRVSSSVDDPRQAALGMLLKSYLFSDSSDLTKAVVIGEQLAESVECSWEWHKDASLFAVAAKIKEGKSAEDVLARIQQQLDNVSLGKINDRRLADVKSNLRYSLLMNLTSAENIGGTLAWLSGPAMDTSFVDAVYGALGEVGPKDLQDMAKTRFGAQQRAIVTLKHEARAAKKEEGAK